MPLNRFVYLAVYVLSIGSGCRRAPADLGKSHSQLDTSAVTHDQEIEWMTVERCGVGFRGQISVPAGEVIQKETAQTKECPEDECPGKTLGMMYLHVAGKTCAQVSEDLMTKPIVDAWGARVRVTCNAHIVQAVSAGRDGKLGTCDDLSNRGSFQVRR